MMVILPVVVLYSEIILNTVIAFVRLSVGGSIGQATQMVLHEIRINRRLTQSEEYKVELACHSTFICLSINAFQVQSLPLRDYYKDNCPLYGDEVSIASSIVPRATSVDAMLVFSGRWAAHNTDRNNNRIGVAGYPKNVSFD